MDELSWIFSPVFTLAGVFLGWILANRSQSRMLKVAEIRNELENAYGPVYSIVSKLEERVEIDEKKTEELRVVISQEEKMELDSIITNYPHMFPLEIVVLWRTKVKNTQPIWITRERGRIPMSYGIPVEFKNKIMKEYWQRLEEYYKATGRAKSIKALPEWARA